MMDCNILQYIALFFRHNKWPKTSVNPLFPRRQPFVSWMVRLQKGEVALGRQTPQPFVKSLGLEMGISMAGWWFFSPYPSEK